MSKVKARIGGRLSLILLFMIGTIIALLVRVAYIKVVYGEEYENAARVQQVSEYDVEVTPNRGTITDRNNVPLAISTTVYNIILDVRVLVNTSVNDEVNLEEIEKTITALSETLEGVDYATLKDYTTIVEKDEVTNRNIAKLDTSWKILAKEQSVEVMETLDALNLKGVVYEKDTKRLYPYGTVASEVIGFIRDSAWGLEHQYNSYLEGLSGRSFLTYDPEKGTVEQEVLALDGHTIVTTLDYNLQKIAESGVINLYESFNPESAGVIIMDPNTGEILAMSEAPTFDVNNPTTPIYMGNEVFANEWNAKTSDEMYEYLNNSWKNFNITSTYEPGSTVKPIVVAAALEEGIISPTDTYYCPGYKVVADRTIRCNLRSGHGIQTVEDALANSCNVALMDIGDELGEDLLHEYLLDFGYSSLSGIDLPNEASAKNLMHNPETMGPVELATMSFGQSFNSTSLQSINAMAATINGGNLMEPYVVSQVVDETGNVVYEKTPELIRKVISEEVSDIVREDMISTVDYGTGKKAKIEGYVFGGKTGTAEQGNRMEGEYAVSYISYIPADNPEYIVMAVIDKPEVFINGVTSVSPTMKSLLEEIIEYKEIPPSYVSDGAVDEKENVLVGNYEGEVLFDVLTELELVGLRYEIVGKGNLVTNQVPAAETSVLEDTLITLYVENGEGETGGIMVPNVIGLDKSEAITLLIDTGFEVVIEGEEEGIVESVYPMVGITGKKGDEITITIIEKPEEDAVLQDENIE